MTWLKDSNTHLNKSEHDNSKSDKSALLCEDCGSTFHRAKEYLAQNRTDPLFKWTCAKCDMCKKKRIDSAFKRMPKIMTALIA